MLDNHAAATPDTEMPSSQDKHDKNKPVDFEKTLAKLEQIIARLEEGDLPLEESVKQFEQGMALLKDCQRTLNQAEQKVKVLIEKNRSFQTEDFEE